MGTFTDRSDQDGPFRVPFCGTFQVLKIPEIMDSILETHFEVRGITISPPWKHNLNENSGLKGHLHGYQNGPWR